MGEVLHIEDALNEKGVYVSTTLVSACIQC